MNRVRRDIRFKQARAVADAINRVPTLDFFLMRQVEYV